MIPVGCILRFVGDFLAFCMKSQGFHEGFHTGSM